MDAEVSLSCEDIERYLGEGDSRVHALRGVSLRASGDGKSTLLCILGLLDHADSGSVNNPSVILADEPTGNLDSANPRRTFELLQRIVQEERKALLLVTHNPEIEEACDWIHEIQDGLIVGIHPRDRR